jgi:hypothetical protein
VQNEAAQKMSRISVGDASSQVQVDLLQCQRDFAKSRYDRYKAGSLSEEDLSTRLEPTKTAAIGRVEAAQPASLHSQGW